MHGAESHAERTQTQHDFNHAPDTSILFVSGQVGDVGIDLTGGDAMIHYDLPWTMADYLQQIARVQRSGQVNEISHAVLLVKGSIDEGIWEYIQQKRTIVRKLIHGIPLHEFERKILEVSEKGGNNPEHNRYLADYYMSMTQRLNQHFGQMKDMSQEAYGAYLHDHAAEYAQFYATMGVKTYQSNANRVSGTLIVRLLEEMGVSPEQAKILDCASGPRMLRTHIADAYQDCVTSQDGN
jgi:superfamily II DNA/RNA helicase